VNFVGTHFGGSLYATVDPHLMILLIHRLGADCVVWDGAASIDFARPGRCTVSATLRVTDAEADAIRAAAAGGEKQLPQWRLEVVDEDGSTVAKVLKTLYGRRKPEALA
jgi:hypothetical protein